MLLFPVRMEGVETSFFATIPRLIFREKEVI